MALTVFTCEYKLLTLSRVLDTNGRVFFVPFAVQTFTEGCALVDPFVRELTSSGLGLISPSEPT